MREGVRSQKAFPCANSQTFYVIEVSCGFSPVAFSAYKLGRGRNMCQTVSEPPLFGFHYVVAEMPIDVRVPLVTSVQVDASGLFILIAVCVDVFQKQSADALAPGNPATPPGCPACSMMIGSATGGFTAGLILQSLPPAHISDHLYQVGCASHDLTGQLVPGHTKRLCSLDRLVLELAAAWLMLSPALVPWFQ
jgi:hypothetical protein